MFRLVSKKLNLNSLILTFFLILLGLLLFKDVFSDRVLLANLGPFPDSLQYVVPARNFAMLGVFNFVREGRVLQESVAPLYPVSLIPAYFISHDPRMFYFSNIGLAITSLILFFSLIIRLTQSKFLIFVALLLYTTNYFIYWYPTLPMAENLLLPIFLLGLWLLFYKNTKAYFAAGLVAAVTYGAKYAAVPLLLTFLGVFVIKIYFEYDNWYFRFKAWLLVLAGFLFGIIPLSIYDQITKGFTVFSSLFDAFSPHIATQVAEAVTKTPKQEYFSINYVPSNLKFYWDAMVGEKVKFLWEIQPIVPKFVGYLGLLGLVLGSWQKSTRVLSLAILILLTNMVIFLSLFYDRDARYIYPAIPSLIIGLTILFNQLPLFFPAKYKSLMVAGVLLLLVGWYLSTQGMIIKNQIALNLRHGETPWLYLSVVKLNGFFSQNSTNQKPIVISSLPPYYIDLYSNGHYQLVPLSVWQDFRDHRDLVWGIKKGDETDFIQLYKSYLLSGQPLYLSQYGIGNTNYLNVEYHNILDHFDHQLVYSGCYDQCNIYQLSLKKNP